MYRPSSSRLALSSVCSLLSFVQPVVVVAEIFALSLLLLLTVASPRSGVPAVAVKDRLDTAQAQALKCDNVQLDGGNRSGYAAMRGRT